MKTFKQDRNFSQVLSEFRVIQKAIRCQSLISLLKSPQLHEHIYFLEIRLILSPRSMRIATIIMKHRRTEWYFYNRVVDATGPAEE